ncbi:MAG: metallophosphoesterase family protein [Anaerolineae bacterium]|jgi:predicted phosphodiesterase|nr:metallophosphoesterase family protein [Anaerolineae bacterium]
MRVAVISDIHGNPKALEAVLADLDQQPEIDGLWCLGDHIGRGPDSLGAVIKLYRRFQQQSLAHRAAWLVGNHDLLIIGKLPDEMWHDDTGETISVGEHNALVIEKSLEERQTLYEHRPDLMAWLETLPPYAEPFPHVFMAHAAYHLLEDRTVDYHAAYMSYIRTGADVRWTIDGLIEQGHRPYLVLGGHTHHYALWQYQPGHSATLIEGIADKGLIQEVGPGHYQLEDLDHAPVFLNPGSVGFPRYPDDQARYVILTMQGTGLTVEFRTVRYNWKEIIYPTGYPKIYRQEIERTPLP